MAVFDILEKYINEHGSAAIRSEVITLLREQAAVEAKKLAEVTAERDTLLVENETLRSQVAANAASNEFKPHRGVLWLKLDSGEYEDTPYCPKCKTIMHPLPPPDYADPVFWSCTPCSVKVTYCDPPSYDPPTG